MAPDTWLSRPFGLTMAPHSNATTIRRSATDRPFTSSSTQQAVYPPFSTPHARPRPADAVRLAAAAADDDQPNLSAAARSTFASRSSATVFNRNASGSVPAARARSSMCDSRAKWLAVAASPRYEPCRSGDCDAWYASRFAATPYGVARPDAPEL